MFRKIGMFDRSLGMFQPSRFVSTFSPSQLFSAGEQGAWYDPSDWTTLFEDSAGTTPITAVEKPVGLMLDKSKGLVLGPELVTNGTFDTDSGWTKGAGWTISNGAASVNTSVQVFLTQNILSAPAGSYLVSFNVLQRTSGTLRVAFGGAYREISSNGSYTFIVNRSTSGITSVQVYTIGTTALTIDNISVRELAGNHAFQTTTTSRPILRNLYNLLTYTEQFDNAVWVRTGIAAFGSGSVANTAATTDPLGGNTADFILPYSASQRQRISQSVTVQTGVQYKQTYYVKPSGYTKVALRENNTSGYYVSFDLSSTSSPVILASSNATGTVTYLSNGWFLCTMITTITGTNFGAGIYVLSSNYTSGDPETPVWSPNQTDGIYIWGASLVPANEASLPYQRVVTNTLGSGVYDSDVTKFPLYLAFDGSDDSMSTNSIDFSATDKMSVFAGVRKLSDAAQGVVAELSATIASNNGTFLLSAPNSAAGNYNFSSKGTAQSDNTVTTYAAPITNVISGIADISGDSNLVRVNGASIATITTDQGTGNFGNYVLYIGRRGGTSLQWPGRIYSLVIRGALTSGTQLTNTETWVNSKTGAY